MNSTEYMELALECVREADAALDEDRKQALLDMAKMYNRMALNREANAAQDNTPPLAGIRERSSA